MIAGGYSLHLYCDLEEVKHPYKEFPHEFEGETRTGTARQARAAGWRLRFNTREKEGRAICPACVKEGRK